MREGTTEGNEVMGWYIKPVSEAPEGIFDRLSSVQRALADALHQELLVQDDGPGERYWAAFMPQGGIDPLEIVFCPLGSNEVKGSLKISPEGDITDRTGVAVNFIQ